MKILLTLMLILMLPAMALSQTTVTGTVVDPNSNPYANGTASAIQVVTSGLNSGTPVIAPTNPSGFFTMSLSSPATYQFTICAMPTQIGPKGNPTPTQICFISNPVAISGGSQDVSAVVNPLAKIIGPQFTAGAVSSVFGRTGPVIAQTGDYNCLQVSNCASLNQNNTFTGNNNFMGPTTVSNLLNFNSTSPGTCTSSLGNIFYNSLGTFLLCHGSSNNAAIVYQETNPFVVGNLLKAEDIIGGAGDSGIATTNVPLLNGNNSFTGTNAHSGIETFSGQSILTNPCTIDGLIYVSVGGCYTTLQAAITALSTSPGTVIVPPGTFATTSTTTLTSSDQHIVCSGMGSSVISYTGSGAITAVLDIGTSTGGGAANQWNNSVEGCTISGNANVTDAIRTRGVHHATLKNLDLRNVTGDGIDTNFAVVGEYDNIHCSLNDAVFVVQPTNCVHLDGPNASAKTTASTVKNLVAEGVSGAGLLLGQTIETKIIAGTSEQNAIGVNITSGSESVSIDGLDMEVNSSEDILNNGIGLYVKGNSGCYSTTKLVAGSTSQITSYEIGNNTCTPTINAGAIEVTSPAGVLGGTTPNNLQFLNTTTTCTTGGAIGAICTTGTITLPFAEQDTNYRLSCTGLGPTNVPIVQTVTKSSASFTITIAALTAAAASFSSYDCLIGHN
jgi:hypothetical protein